MMKTRFKYAMLFMAACAMTFTFTACSDDDDEKNEDNGSTISTDAKYKDRSYGQDAVDACANVVSQMDAAYAAIAGAQLTADQDTYLRSVLTNLVNEVIVETYKDLADDTEDLERTLNGLTVNTITQAQINRACDDFKDAREEWERSEAFLGGAASEFDIDPTIDSWPLNRTLLVNYLKSGKTDFTDEQLEDATILGFHALEFILFRNGQPRKVAEFQGNDTYKGFESISGATELAYAQTICKLLKERTYQLQVAWEGETSQNSVRVATVKAAGLEYTTSKGKSFGWNLINAGNANSTFATLQDAIAQILNADEGSAAAIATEVGTAKIANPFSAGDISYVESPYSYNSITDFQDNIRSIQNVWFGNDDGKADSKPSFHGFFAAVGNSTLNNSVESAISNAINKIGKMPAPFVKYCSTVWDKEFSEDNTWD